MVSLKHKFHSEKGDATDSSRIRPSSWNDEHELKMSTANSVLGRDGSASVTVQELPFQIESTGRVRATGTLGFTVPNGTTAQRPSDPRLGEMRFNTETSQVEIYGVGGTNWVAIALDLLLPVGLIAAFPLVTPPSGWLICDGAEYNKVTYARLFTYLGLAYTAGSVPPANFCVPNYKGRVLMGVGSSGGVTTPSTEIGEEYGATKHEVALTAAQMPSHFHTLGVGSNGEVVNRSTIAPNMGGVPTSDSNFILVNPNESVISQTGSAGGGVDGAETKFNTTPYQPSTSVQLCIKY